MSTQKSISVTVRKMRTVTHTLHHSSVPLFYIFRCFSPIFKNIFCFHQSFCQIPPCSISVHFSIFWNPVTVVTVVTVRNDTVTVTPNRHTLPCLLLFYGFAIEQAGKHSIWLAKYSLSGGNPLKPPKKERGDCLSPFLLAIYQFWHNLFFCCCLILVHQAYPQ